MKSKIKKLLLRILGSRKKKITDTLNHIWVWLCKKMPLRNVVFFYTIRANGRLLDNAETVYDALDCKKIVFAKMLPHPQKIKPLIYYRLLTSKVIVTDDYNRYMRAVTLRKEQRLIQIWHASGAFKCFGLDAPSRLTKQEEKATHSQYSAVIVSSESCRDAYAGAFGIDREKCLALGSPRTDKLLDEKTRAAMKEEVYSAHPEFRNKRIYLYCPTFREVNGKYTVFDSEIDWQKLSDSLSEDEIFVLRRHPLMKYKMIKGVFPNVVDLSNESTLALTAACDVLITDYSSVIYDACLLDKPMVFYCPDFESYDRNFYLRYPQDLPGVTVTEGDELLNEIRSAQAHPPLEKIEKFRANQMGACDGNSTARVAKLIKDMLEQ